MNFNPYANYFYHGYDKSIHQINYETKSTIDF